MEKEHHHSHDHHAVTLTSVNTAFVIGIILNLLFVFIEAGVGLFIHSLSLISDAAHNLADVASLALALLAFRLLKVRSNKNFTYGYRKTSILVALFNALLLVGSIAVIVYEAVQRLFHPQPTQGTTIAILAGIGVLVNGLSAFLFMRNKEKDINIKSAYLHLLSDALVSFGIVVGGLIIYFTQWFWIDSALSILVAIVILISTWGILKDSLRLSLDGVPTDIDLEKIKEVVLQQKNIKQIYHIHVWAISSAENAMTAHLVLNKSTSTSEEHQLKKELKHELLHQNIHHVTLETEREDESKDSVTCELSDGKV